MQIQPALTVPAVTPPVLVAQSWSDAVFLHWRVPAAAAASRLPEHVEPDVFLGSTWVGRALPIP